MRFHRSPLNPYSARELTKSIGKASVIIVSCHAHADHQSTVRKVVPVAGQLLHYRKLLRFARGQMQLSATKLIARLQLSLLENTLISYFFVLSKKLFSSTIRFLLRSKNRKKSFEPHSGIRANFLLQLPTFSLVPLTQGSFFLASAQVMEQC